MKKLIIKNKGAYMEKISEKLDVLSDFDKVLDNNLFKAIEENGNCRYMSWEHCYSFFFLNRENILQDEKMLDLAALNLGFYLGNWGMFRSSFLMENDYKIHIPVIRELLSKCSKLRQTYDNISWKDIDEANKIIKNGYKDFHKPEHFF